MSAPNTLMPASKPFRDRYAGRPTPGPTRETASGRELEADGDARAERILSRVRRIPEGRVMTFGDIDPQAPVVSLAYKSARHDGQNAFVLLGRLQSLERRVVKGAKVQHVKDPIDQQLNGR